ncbi:glycoside hydrolase family 3 protein [Cercospora zeae-maydis SCOH1-5]|uniref:xylan 1,4-beta-xylosidase n=1 Tax=Cercospora zeae-maydis SCOH1-5 TaxID=717836 RepID=A0A6A6FE74_9PEZI|nr:glycoside hydrolase family 3 protein [Cercospora zeae-maydis SCOH1-5]
MPRTLALLAFVAQAWAQLEGRGFPDCSNGPLADNAVCDQSLDHVTRAKALIAEFTIAEKINNTISTSPGVPRLGLPAYTWWQEALHGVAQSPGVNFSQTGDFRYATSFPQPILMGAAFDDALIKDVASVISTEARAFNNFDRAGLDFWTPNINPFKDLRWGRGQETPGEDPYHLSSYVHHLIQGLQGDDEKYRKVTATCKHFVAYDMENWNGNLRYQFDAHVGSQELVEYYMPPFKACARDSNVGAFMCSYNSLNGVPTCADPWLLQDVLRDHWNWSSPDYWVTSDCDAIQNVFLPHEYAATREEAVALSLKAGTDINCGTYYSQHLTGAYAQGLINETDLDVSLVRQYTSLIRMGYFDGTAVPWRNLTFADVSTPYAEDLAYRAAVEGITLLKNDGTLPLKISSGTKLALIGDWANATTQMLGNYAGIPPYFHGPYWAANQTGAEVLYARGPGGQGDPTTDHWAPVFSAANESDIIVFAGGIDNGAEFEGSDRTTMAWTGAQLDIILALASYGKPMIVLQMGAGQLDDTALLKNENISAILWGGYPGQDGGRALFDIIQGVVAPAGRLPTTQYPAKYIAQIPMTDMQLRANATSGSPGRTYMWYNEEPVLPFAHGLHYTNFTAQVKSGGSSGHSSDSYEISSLLHGCSESYLDRCAFQTFSVDVANTGSVTSDYVTLGFLAGTHGPAPHPNKRLVAYERLHNITGGSTATAALNLTLGSLARVDDKGNTVLYPGDYALLIDVQPLTTVNFTLTGEATTLDHWPQPPAERVQTGDYFVGGYGSGAPYQLQFPVDV